MKNLYKLALLLCVVFTYNSCDEGDILKSYNGDTVLSFDAPSKTIGICEPTGTITVQSSSTSNSDRTFNLIVNNDLTTADPSEYTLPGSVTIPAGEYSGSAIVSIDFTEIPEGESRALVVDLDLPEGVAATRGTTTLEYVSACTLNETTLSFVFDTYPQEFAWQLFDADNGNAFVAGDTGFGNYAGLGNYSETLCLPSGNYLLRLLDSFGDGFCCNYGEGSATVLANDCDGDTVILEVPGPDFQSGELVVPFVVGQ